MSEGSYSGWDGFIRNSDLEQVPGLLALNPGLDSKISKLIFPKAAGLNSV